MTIQFKYQKHYDLVLHLLAHVKVDNASALYCEGYIATMRHLRQDDSLLVAGCIGRIL